MSERPFRILVAAGDNRDRTLLAEVIAQAGLCAEVVCTPLEDIQTHLSRTSFEAVVVDAAGAEPHLQGIPQTLPPNRLIYLADAGQATVPPAALRQGAAEIIVKDQARMYLELLPLRIRTILDAAPQPITEPKSPATDPLPGEYEQLAHSLFEHSPNMIFINAAGRVVYANQKCVDVMGYSREEFYAPDFHFLNLISPDSVDIIKLNFGRHTRGQEVDPYDYALITRTGRRIEAVMASKLIHYGGQTAILGIITDISHRRRVEDELTRARCELERRIRERTEELVKTNESLLTEIRDRQRAEKALRESEERYRTISSLTSDFIYASSEGQIEWVGGAFEKITGYGSAEMATFDDWLGIIHPEDVAAVRKSAGNAIAGESAEIEYRIRTRQGGLRWLCDHIHPICDDTTGQITSVIGAVRDVTERKQAVEALKESELKFKTIFENAGGAIFIADTETGLIVECNTEAEKLTGLPRSKLIGLHQSHLHPCRRSAESTFHRHVEQGQAIDFEGEVLHADGRRIPVWISSQCLVSGPRKFIVGLFIDMTAKRRSDQQRAGLMEMLEEKNRELESIIHVAGHDLRTPLITIAGFAGELRNSCSRLRELLGSERLDDNLRKQADPIILEDIPEAVGLITASAAKLNSLIEGLTRLARLDQPGDEMNPIRMNAMLDQIIKTLTYEARHRKVEFRVGTLPDAWGDEQQLNQVFSNLLGNAIKYLHPARPGVISITGARAEDSTLYSVEDNGIGIDANNLPHIFKMYYRVDPTQTDGQGLGLAIVRRILSRHNGRVWAESNVGEGSSFFIALPNPPI